MIKKRMRVTDDKGKTVKILRADIPENERDVEILRRREAKGMMVETGLGRPKRAVGSPS